jgi:hypothetical protein
MFTEAAMDKMAFYEATVTGSTTQVPEPSTLLLLVSGLGIVALLITKKLYV